MAQTDELLQSLEYCKESTKSISDLLSYDHSSEIAKDSILLRKQFILETLVIRKAHDTLQRINLSTKQSFTEDTVRPYNEKMVHVTRLDDEVRHLRKQLSSLKKSVYLPKILITQQTLISVLDGKYLKYAASDDTNTDSMQTDSVHEDSIQAESIQKDCVQADSTQADSSRAIDILEIFSLNPEDGLPKPVYSDFKLFLELELKYRLTFQIKHDLLLLIKRIATDSKDEWVLQDARLSSFIEKDLSNVLKGIAKVRASE